MEEKATNVNKRVKYLITIALSFAFITCRAQTGTKTNIEIFKQSVSKVFFSDINFKGYNFEGFSILVKINGAGKIDTCLISLSALPDLRDRLNIIKSHIDFSALLLEAKDKNWKDANIILPVFALYESSSLQKSFIQLGDYSNNRLKYFSTFDPLYYDKPITNVIYLSPIIMTATEIVR